MNEQSFLIAGVVDDLPPAQRALVFKTLGLLYGNRALTVLALAGF